MLSTVPLFQNLSDAQLASIGAHLSLRVIEKGAEVVRQGALADCLYLIVAGHVKVFRTDPDDPSREVILRTLGPGEFFGELPVFDQEPRSASVTTLDQCHLQVLSYGRFQHALANSPDIAQRVMQTLASRLRAADRRIGDLALHDIASRVSRVLLELAIMSNGRRVVGQQFTQQDLANMVGASREMVNRTLRDLETSGYITVQRRSITILNEEMPT